MHGSINGAIRQAKYMVSCYEYGVVPEYDNHLDRNRLQMLFGSEYVKSMETEFRNKEELANRHLEYDEAAWEQYHLRRYHVDIKPWLDYIDQNNMPLELYHNTGVMTWKENDRDKKQEVTLYRFLDTETKYKIDFESFEEEIQPEDYSSIKGKFAHVKYIWTEPEYQNGFYKMNKTVRRSANLLFNNGHLSLNGWCLPYNDKDIRTDSNWRKKLVYGTDRDGNRSESKQPKLLWMYLYSGWVVEGIKQDNALISYYSKDLYNYWKRVGHDVDEQMKYARNFSYDNK